MGNTTQRPLWQKILIILLGGFLLGFLWRLRGSRGWGSEAGVFNVGFVYLLFITTVMGERKKLDLGWLSRILLPVFVGFMFLSYFFVASAEHRAIVEVFTLHNILVIISAVSVLAYSFVLLKKSKV